MKLEQLFLWDFVRLLGSYEQLSSKIHNFNKQFKITNPEHLTTELTRLQSEGFDISRDLAPYYPQYLIQLMRLLQLQQQSNKLFLLRNYDLRNRLSEKTLQSLLLFCQEYNDKNKIVVNDGLIEIFDGDKHSQNEEEKINLNESRKEKKRAEKSC